MSRADQIAYFFALVTVVSLPPAVVYWYVIHPFAARWQRLGPLVTYFIVAVIYLAIAAGLFAVREPLLRLRWDGHPLLIGLGGLGYLTAVAISLRIRKQLTLRIMVGMPEIAPDTEPQRLLTTGIYSRTRNPRYLAIMIAIFGVAMMTNYLAVWVLAVVMVPAMRLLVRLEERELGERFGAAYHEYCQSVPRFVPRLAHGG